MTGLFFSSTILVTIILYLLFPKYWLSAFILFCIFTPYLNLGSFGVRFEAIATPFILCVFIYKIIVQKNGVFLVNQSSVFLFITVLLGLSVTFYNTILDPTLGINAIPIFSNLNLIAISIILYNATPSIKTHEIIRNMIILCSIPASLLAITQTLGVGLALELTRLLYTSSTRDVVERYAENSGSLFRAVSVFESPSYAAIFFLFSLLACLQGILDKNTRINRIIVISSITLSVIAGFLTFSATFIIGIALILAYISMANIRKFGVLSIVILGLYSFGHYSLQVVQNDKLLSGNFNYQIDRIFSGNAFATRFDENSGLIFEARRAIAERPFLGWGWNVRDNIFVGDSLYISVAYYSGIIGLILLVAAIYPHLNIRRFIDYRFYIGIIVIILATGSGTPSAFGPRISVLFWLIIAALQRELRIAKESTPNNNEREEL